MTIRLLVACSEERRAQAHCATLTRLAGDAIAAASASLDDVIRTSSQQRPEVVLLEHAPDNEERLWGILHRLALVSPGSRVLLLCDVCTDRMVISFIANGALGSVGIDNDPALWVKAVMAVQRGEGWFARSAVLQALRRQLAAQARDQSVPAHKEQLLTTREREILSLIGGGMSNKEIGRSLSISDQTVKTHLHHIYVKLNRSGRYKAFAATPAPIATAARNDGDRATPH